MTSPLPLLSPRQIIQMNVGFLGLQFSFGLQQSNMSPIYSYLGAEESALPLLYLAGPVTGLLVQPIVGAMSDRTDSRWGRRTPYFLVGAILCSLTLLAMPYRRAVWMGMKRDAVDANGIPDISRISFLIGAVLSAGTILYSVLTVRELPLTAAQRAEIRSRRHGLGATLREIRDAIVEMPTAMRQLAVMKLFQWYAMVCYWQYIVHALGRQLFDTADSGSAGFREAVLVNGQAGAFYNLVACVSAFAMVPLTRRFGAGRMHALCLTAAGLGMLAIHSVSDGWWLLLPMVGVGLGWGSMMGNPYVMLAGSIPPQRTGVYMGIFNMMIVIPMLIQSATLGWVYERFLGHDPRQVVAFAGGLLLCAAVATLFVKVPPAPPSAP